MVPLRPGEVIFTGTVAGIGAVRQGTAFLGPGDLLETWVEGIGILRNRFVADASPGRDRRRAGQPEQPHNHNHV